MDTPKRIQRKRTKGWRMPDDTIYIGRGSRWGNPFVVGKDGTALECIAKYVMDLCPYTHHGNRNTTSDFMISMANLAEIKFDLGGYNLACWCKENEPCHGDWLLKMANMEGL